MPMPSFVRKVNRRVFNPAALRRGTWPVLVHRGRRTGERYETPLGIIPSETGFAVLLVYGASRTEWLANLLAAGEGKVVIEGERHRVSRPRVVSIEEARGLLPPREKLPPKFLGVTEMVLLERDG